jgi:hypothetical protein
MKRFLIIFVLFIIFLGACEENGDNIEIFLQKQPGSVAGRVYPFNAEATVGLYQGVVRLIAETQTDPDGTFLIKDVQPGVYLLRVSASGYGSFEREEILVSDGESMDVGVIILSTLPWPINSTEPEDGAQDISIDQTVYIYCSKQLESESILSAFSINPMVSDLIIEDFYITYDYPYRHLIRIAGKWIYGTQYDISLGTSLTTILGERLEFPLLLKYTFEPFCLREVQLPVSDDYSGYINLRFNGELDISNFFANFIITPPEIGNINLGYSNRVYIDAPGCWHPGITSITLKAGLSENGGSILGTDTTFTFIIDSLAVRETYPFNGMINVDVNSNVQIYFSYRIDETTAVNAVTIDPEISFNIWRGYDYIELNPYSSFGSDTTYTVTIDTSLHDYWGNPLSNPYSFSFTTE